ncbi:molybdopterin-dependent oxidoreductase [Pedobacter sp. HMF7647]|uniref:Molybdopterin-dependent oxidoreductase n=1 Tax=Hufsiella arboris TaxID=2695275 RepID=A0A7K1Y588_9SPHI|nr:molybdopterin-dependent oxidoreductase [Hufsiella arboris]MXV49753.1 molybdopterin-dependent oxidoreductase [Hufsiella arboris]
MKIYVLFILLLISHFAFSQDHPEGKISEKLAISGLVNKQLSLTLSDLKELKTVELKNVKIIGKGGDVKRTIPSLKGYLLKDIINMAGIAEPNFKENGMIYFIASATDDYNVLCSWSEVFNSASDQVFVVTEEDGQPLNKDGKFALLCLKDKINGLRFVKWLNRIEVKKAN